MPTINQLSSLNTLSTADQMVVYSTNNGDARKASLQTLLNLVSASYAAPDFQEQTAIPSASGFSVQVNDSGENTFLILSPLAPYAAGTIVLPTNANCLDGQEVIVACNQPVTALTVSGNGAIDVVGEPTSLGAGSAFALRYSASQKIWYCIGSNNVSDSGGAVPGYFTTLTSTSTTTLNGTTIPASKTLVTTVDTQTLTNKTINLSSNTLVATSAQLAAAVTDETGSGSLVFATSPTLITPVLGVATATRITVDERIIGGTESVITNSALSINKVASFLGTDAVNPLNVTMSAGANGQIKFISLVLDGGEDAVATINSLLIGSTITFDDAGDSVTLLYSGDAGGWIVLANNGCTIA
jgi:hypothetical protein